MTSEQIEERRLAIHSAASSIYNLAKVGSSKEMLATIIKELLELHEIEVDALKDRIKDLEEGAKAHERQLRNIMPDRSDDI